METAIYTLTSELHDETAVNAVTKSFLDSLQIEYEFKGANYDDYGTHPLNLIFVRTGGTEGVFLRLLTNNQLRTDHPFYLLTSGKSNSLAASMEILSFLRQQGMRGEIIHGSPQYISERIKIICRVNKASKSLRGSRLGIIGKPSDWLISSTYDQSALMDKLGIQLVDIPMPRLMQAMEKTPVKEPEETTDMDCVKKSLPVANQIYGALKSIVADERLNGLTIRCFDLLTSVHNTGCLALAKLNSEGIVAGCEGDVPTMITMTIAQSLTGLSGFQANPSSINPETGEIIFAHCTIPLNMVDSYEFDTHFESGIGVGIRGKMPEGAVTIFKVSGDMKRFFLAEGTLLRNQSESDLCRTQIVVKLTWREDIHYFLNEPIGNHHVIIPGHHGMMIIDFMHIIDNQLEI